MIRQLTPGQPVLADDGTGKMLKRGTVADPAYNPFGEILVNWDGADPGQDSTPHDPDELVIEVEGRLVPVQTHGHDELLADLDRRFTYHPPRPEQVPMFERIRREALVFARTLAELCPESIELDAALYGVDEAVMWANAAIARRSDDGD